MLDKNPHPSDIIYEFRKTRVDTLGIPFRPPYYATNSNFGDLKLRTGPLFQAYRRGLEQFESYMEASSWVIRVHGPCSFFIKGYKWPWHTRKNYVGILFPTDTAYRKD